MAIGFVGATSAPGFAFAPDGSAASFLTAYEMKLPVCEAPPDVTPKPVQRTIHLALSAPPEADGKPIAMFVRGFVYGKGEMFVSVNGAEAAFAYELRDPPPGVELPEGNDIDVTHNGVARAGENVLRVRLSLPHLGNDPTQAKFIIESIDVSLDGGDLNNVPRPQPEGEAGA